MRWCQFIDWLKFETRPSSLLNFGTACHFGFVFGENCQGNHVIIVTSSFSKSSVFKLFPAHTETPSHCFQIPPVWRTFSKSSVLLRDGLVWTEALTVEIKLRFEISSAQRVGCLRTWLHRVDSLVSLVIFPNKCWIMNLKKNPDLNIIKWSAFIYASWVTVFGDEWAYSRKMERHLPVKMGQPREIVLNIFYSFSEFPT